LINISIKKVLLHLVAVVSLVLFVWYLHDWYNSRYTHNEPQRVASKGYRFTSPLLDFELPEGVGINDEPMSFRYQLEKYVRAQTSSGQAKEISVYYRDLHDGPWFGIDEEIEFNPTSMLKVPIMVACLKMAENTPLLLKSVIVNHYSDDLRVLQRIKPAQSAEQGRSYTVEELLRLMIVYSDNNATRLLYDKITSEEFNNALLGMGIDTNNRSANSLTVHEFSSIFRILYNASYLNREMSEKALQLLSAPDFAQGIVGGVPKGVVVSSKFGELTEGSSNEIKRLHEFGIIYHHKHPYILGIATKGSDYDKLANVIQGVSRLVYSEVNAEKSTKKNHN
jgi:beta-lactamase class A